MSAQPRSISEWQQPVAKKVYEAISAITGELAKVGIAKTRKNAQQGYAFRGIDDVYSALSRLLAQHRLCVIPRVQSRTVTEQQSKSGGILFYAVLDVEYDLVSAEDGSMHTARAVGEAMDSGDKSSNKAMSAAYKYMAMQVFCIPTEGDNDTENQTHEVRANVHNPNDDVAPSGISADQAKHVASQMLGILDANMGDDWKALKAADLHGSILSIGGEPLYRAAWRVLKDSPGKRSQWKTLLDLAHEKEMANGQDIRQ